MTRFADLTADQLALLKRWRYDRIIEKHEGPESWESFLKWHGAGEIDVDGRAVLLPLDEDRRVNVTVLRSFESEDGHSLTVFLKDTSLAQYYGPGDEWSWAGFLAVCDRLPGTELYVAVVYHEWFIVGNNPGAEFPRI